MKKKITHFKIKKRQLVMSLGLSIMIFAVTFPLLTFLFIYHGRIYPGVFINNTNVSGLTTGEAQNLVSSQEKIPETINITLASGSAKEVFTVPTKAFGAVFEYDKAVEAAFEIGRSGRRIKDSANLALLFINNAKVPLTIYIDKLALYEQVSIISSQIREFPQKPQIYLSNGEVLVTEAKGGYVLDIKKAESKIGSALKNGRSNIALVADYKNSALSEAQLNLLVARATKLKTKKI